MTVGGRWRTALLVFLLAVTMSTAVLAAGGIGVSRLDRPVSQIPPAPDVSPFRVVGGVTVTPGEDGVLPPVAAPPEFADSALTTAPAQRPAAVRELAPRRFAERPPVAAPLPVPRPAPSGQRPGEPEPARHEPAPAPRPQAPERDEDEAEAAPPPDTVRPDAEPAEQDDERGKRKRAAGQDESRSGGPDRQRGGGASPEGEAGKRGESGHAQPQKASGGAGRR